MHHATLSPASITCGDGLHCYEKPSPSQPGGQLQRGTVGPTLRVGQNHRGLFPRPAVTIGSCEMQKPLWAGLAQSLAAKWEWAKMPEASKGFSTRGQGLRGHSARPSGGLYPGCANASRPVSVPWSARFLQSRPSGLYGPGSTSKSLPTTMRSGVLV